MCEQCLCNPIYFGQPFEGFTLARARVHGNDWKKGQWALIECNDPTFVWYDTPVIDGEWSEEFWDAFDCTPSVGHKLYEACLKVGYNRETDGFFIAWLYDYLAGWIESTPINDDVDDGNIKTDYSIKKQPL
jgi:hypothetical protein